MVLTNRSLARDLSAIAPDNCRPMSRRHLEAATTVGRPPHCGSDFSQPNVLPCLHWPLATFQARMLPKFQK